MNGLVNVEVVNGKPCVTSLQVADAFEKEHKNVLADIRNTISKCSESFNGLNFQLVEYTDTKGEKRPMYVLAGEWYFLPPLRPSIQVRLGFTPAGRVSRDTLHYPRRGYSFMGKAKAPATLTVPGLSAIS